MSHRVERLGISTFLNTPSLCLLSLVIRIFNYFGYVFKHQSNNVFQFQKYSIITLKNKIFDDFFTSVVAALKTVFLLLKKQALNIHCRSLGKSHFFIPSNLIYVLLCFSLFF